MPLILGRNEFHPSSVSRKKQCCRRRNIFPSSPSRSTTSSSTMSSTRSDGLSPRSLSPIEGMAFLIDGSDGSAQPSRQSSTSALSFSFSESSSSLQETSAEVGPLDDWGHFVDFVDSPDSSSFVEKTFFSGSRTRGGSSQTSNPELPTVAE